MKGLEIVSVRGTYFTIHMNGAALTNETFTYAQAEERYKLYYKIYKQAWDDAVDWVNEDL